MMNDEHGCTVCNVAGQEKYESYMSGFGRKKTKMYQYDYRHTDGELFSCCAPTLDECRRRRNAWLDTKQ